MKVKCTLCTAGSWTEGADYDAEPTTSGLIIIGDDRDPSSGWALILTEWDPVVGASFACPGLVGEAHFTEVKYKPLPLDFSAIEERVLAHMGGTPVQHLNSTDQNRNTVECFYGGKLKPIEGGDNDKA